jgi:hypothetical protein
VTDNRTDDGITVADDTVNASVEEYRDFPLSQTIEEAGYKRIAHDEAGPPRIIQTIAQ